jgi:Putative addiction module component
MSNSNESPIAEVAQLWLTEAAKRAAEIDEGLVQLISSEEADRELKEFLNS